MQTKLLTRQQQGTSFEAQDIAKNQRTHPESRPSLQYINVPGTQTLPHVLQRQIVLLTIEKRSNKQILIWNDLANQKSGLKLSRPIRPTYHENRLSLLNHKSNE